MPTPSLDPTTGPADRRAAAHRTGPVPGPDRRRPSARLIGLAAAIVVVAAAAILAVRLLPHASGSHAAQTFDQPTLAENPTVRAVCSLSVLLSSRRVAARLIPAADWQIEVLPPAEAAFDSGARTYRCVAGVTGSQPAISQFRR